MSDSQNSSAEVNANGTQSTEEREQYVARKAYEEVTRDMHKYKSKAKEAEAAKAEYEARLKAIEEEKMRDNQQWKELYEKTKAEQDALKRQVEDRDKQFIRSVKVSALKNELGGVRDEYLSLARVDDIEVIDGRVNPDSLHLVANEFRQNHPQLLPQAKVPQPTGNAAPVGYTVQPKTKSLGEMSYAEKAAMLREIKNNRN